MKLLISGTTGFIGKHLCKNLRLNGIDFTCIVRADSDISPFEKNNVSYFKFGNNLNFLITFMRNEKFDGVIHLASLFIAEHKNEQINDLIGSNILFGTNLLQASAESGVKWFLNTGTFWQHYNGEEYNPVNLYAATKQAFEDIARYYVESSSLIFTTLKLNDTHGEGDTRIKIFTLWDQIAKSGEILDMSPGGQLIDIVHVDHVINAYLKLINLLNNENSKDHNLKSYYITSGRKITLKELAKEYEIEHKVKLNINWAGRTYRKREVMKPKCFGEIIL